MTGMFVSPETYSELNGRFVYSWQLCCDRVDLPLVFDFNALAGLGYVVVNNRYIGCFNLREQQLNNSTQNSDDSKPDQD